MSETGPRRTVVGSIEAEFRRYEALAGAAFEQLDREALIADPGHGSSIATIAWHISGNLESRFTDFLTTDGEKPWRNRESEFESRAAATVEDVREKWARGWRVLFDALEALTDDDLGRAVTIRGVHFTVLEALHRALAHIAYHVGQIVQSARAARGDDWEFLSIPPGGSEAYNRAPDRERPAAGP